MVEDAATQKRGRGEKTKENKEENEKTHEAQEKIGMHALVFILRVFL